MSDADDIGRFQFACWQEAYRGLVPDAFLDAMRVEERIRSWTARVVGGTRRIALARSDGEVVGVVSWTPSEVVELNTLYVAEEHRGTGLADTLLERGVGDSPSALWVFEGNRRAQRFYLGRGFVPTGELAADRETGLVELRLARAARSGPAAAHRSEPAS